MLRLPQLNQPPQVDQYEDIMSPLIFNLESVTPIFMAGAHNVLRREIKDRDGRVIQVIEEDYEPEFRIPSFRGVLRYWYRACQGSFLFNNLDELRQRETAIFGNTSIGSMLNISIIVTQMNKERLPMLIHGGRERIRVKSLKNIKFGLKFSGKLSQTADSEILKFILTLFTEFGGIGKRSRRGFGSLRLTNERPMPTSGESLKKRLAKICDSFGDLAKTPFPNLPSFPVMHPDHCKIIVGVQAFGSYQEAMQVFWDEIRDSRQFAGVQVMNNPVFGKPDPRFAAPVQLHISRSNEGYHPVVTAFRTSTSYRGRAMNWGLAADVMDKIARNCKGDFILGGGSKW